MSISEAKYYSAQLILGLEHIHANNISHNDIHSGNILIGNDGNLKISDFGLATEGLNYENRNYDCTIRFDYVTLFIQGL